MEESQKRSEQPPTWPAAFQNVAVTIALCATAVPIIWILAS